MLYIRVTCICKHVITSWLAAGWLTAGWPLSAGLLSSWLAAGWLAGWLRAGWQTPNPGKSAPGLHGKAMERQEGSRLVFWVSGVVDI